MTTQAHVEEGPLLILLLVVAAIECGRRALVRLRAEGALGRVLLGSRADKVVPESSRNENQLLLRSLRHVAIRVRTLLFIGVAGSAVGVIGLHLIGPLGLLIGATVGGLIPRLLERRRAARVGQELERQLAETAEATAMAVRSGFSIAQALEFAAQEANSPMSEVLGRCIDEQRLGMPFEEALRRYADDLDTPDARLFTLVVRIHARSGGSLAGAVDEVAATIRHRIAVRRELRALSAQGRISGSILGALPIAFFLVLAATSHQDLAPIYRSPAGIAMITSGLLMECLAFLWIRRLLRVEA
jgi:tight adherence protein B